MRVTKVLKKVAEDEFVRTNRLLAQLLKSRSNIIDPVLQFRQIQTQGVITQTERDGQRKREAHHPTTAVQ